jgi:hypothetical protein
MTPIDKTADRYRNDSAFRALVDSMRYAIESLMLAPSEVREAAMLAVYMSECGRTVRVVIGEPLRFNAHGAFDHLDEEEP